MLFIIFACLQKIFVCFTQIVPHMLDYALYIGTFKEVISPFVLKLELYPLHSSVSLHFLLFRLVYVFQPFYGFMDLLEEIIHLELLQFIQHCSFIYTFLFLHLFFSFSFSIASHIRKVTTLYLPKVVIIIFFGVLMKDNRNLDKCVLQLKLCFSRSFSDSVFSSC